MRPHFALLLLLAATPTSAKGVEYRTGGTQLQGAWDRFYQGDHEPELDDPLIEAGPAMTTAICSAIRHRDMRLRRYAIGALGYIRDRRALPTLDAILKDESELGYFRADALQAIHCIDAERGMARARELRGGDEILARIASDVIANAAWLCEPTEELLVEEEDETPAR